MPAWKDRLKLPPLRPGSWSGEIVGGCSVNFGPVVDEAGKHSSQFIPDRE